MLLVLLFCVSSLSRLPEVWTMDSGHHQAINVRDALQVRNIVRDIVKEEVDDAWSKLVSGLQQRLALQDRRMKILERRLKRRDNAIARLLSKLDIPDTIRDDADESVTYKEHVIHPMEKIIERADSKTKTSYPKHHKDKSTEERIRRKENKDTVSLIPRLAMQEPDEVAFTAVLDHAIPRMSPGHTIKLNQVLLNEGNGYSAHTGLFTAPTTGVYLFNFHISSHYHYTRVKLVVNNVEQVEAIVYPQNSVEKMGGNTAVVRVIAGQSVWLEDVDVNGELRGYRLCSFSGVLLYSCY